MERKARREMIQAFPEELQGMMRRPLEERATPTKANGCSTRDLRMMVGPVPRISDRRFGPTVAVPIAVLT